MNDILPVTKEVKTLTVFDVVDEEICNLKKSIVDIEKQIQLIKQNYDSIRKGGFNVF